MSSGRYAQFRGTRPPVKRGRPDDALRAFERPLRQCSGMSSRGLVVEVLSHLLDDAEEVVYVDTSRGERLTVEPVVVEHPVS